MYGCEPDVLCFNTILPNVVLAFLYWQETYTEIAGMERFGAFYMDYLYTVEHSRGKGMASLAFAFTSPGAAQNEGNSIVCGPLADCILFYYIYL